MAINTLQNVTSPNARLDHLDMLRGLAALLVMAGHLRAFVFASYAENPANVDSLIAMAFYFMTSLGHLAVLMFFALSGYLVGGKVLLDFQTASFHWARYLARRLTRLWMVVVPLLALTALLDVVGAELTDGKGYDGRYYSILNSGPSPDGTITHDIVTLLGNLAFLQTIVVDVFGTNGPMWSLANEFWYYMLFPLVIWICSQLRAPAARNSGTLLAVVLLIVLLAALPWALLQGGFIWLAGAVAAWSVRQQYMIFWLQRTPVRLVAAALFIGAILATKVPALQVSNLVFGLVVAAVLPVMALLPASGGCYSKLARGLSELSYTLYLSHFPLLMLLAMSWIGPSRYPFGVQGMLAYLALLIAAMAWAAGLWWCFERQTNRVYRYVQQKLIDG